jgi:DNA-binding GntR family transcriptional regulator
MTLDQRPSRAIGSAHLPLRHAVYLEVRSRIIAGHWEPGERLFEDQIALELEVSRNPVREALQALSAEGFVELEPRRGARVAVISPERAVELFEVREALEGLVARLAAQRRTDDDIAELRNVLADADDALARQDTSAMTSLNSRFHELLGRISGNSMLAETVAHLSHLIEWVYRRSISRRSAQSWLEHAEIVAAIEAGDVAQAHVLSTAHVAAAKDAFLAAADTAS